MATDRGKKYLEVAKQVDKTRTYSPKEAVEIAKETNYVKFDPTVEVHLRLGVDPRHADQQVRGVAMLPAGLGKEIRVLVFAQGEAEKIAEEAGANFVGSDDLIKRIEGGWIDFDIAIATPEMMGKVGRLGKILGRRGLMPNPKSGTIAQQGDLPRIVRDARKGRVEFKLDRTGIIHVPIGKLSFSSEKILENLAALVDAITRAKPTGAKGQYIRSITLSTTMGPGIKLDLNQAAELASQSAA
jgi:large subunit ribosomal protein L1